VFTENLEGLMLLSLLRKELRKALVDLAGGTERRREGLGLGE